MMNMQQYVKMLQDGASITTAHERRHEPTEVLAGHRSYGDAEAPLRIRTTSRPTGMHTVLQRLACRRASRAASSARTRDTRYSLSGNYFDQGG